MFFENFALCIYLKICKNFSSSVKIPLVILKTPGGERVEQMNPVNCCVKKYKMETKTHVSE